MQLQRSLFSFYKVFIRKTPICLWMGLAVLLLIIMGSQVARIYMQQPVYKFDQCMMQFFNVTRGAKQQKTNQDKSIINPNKTTQNPAQKTQQIPFYLQPKFYHILNETSIAKIYLSDEIPYVQGKPSCKIVLNTQRIKSKKQEEKLQKNDNQQGQKQKANKFLQQKLPDSIKTHQTQQLNLITKQSNDIETKNNEQTKQEVKRPQNIKDYHELSEEQQKFLLKQHPFMHLTANAHIVYLDQNTEFIQKHGIQTHAIILSRQQVNQYTQGLFGAYSRFWNFHGNDQIQRNGITLKSLADSFYTAAYKIKQIYVSNLQAVNMIISLKKFLESTTINKDQKKDIDPNINNNIDSDGSRQTKNNLTTQMDQTKPVQDKQNDDIKQNQQQNYKISTNTELPQQIPDFIADLPSHLIDIQEVYPLSQMKLYFHYPQTLRVEEVGKLVNTVSQSKDGIFFKIFLVLTAYLHLYLISCLVGLVVRYVFFWIMTLYLFLGGCIINKQWGWVSNYFSLIRNRDYSQQNISWISSAKMLFFFTIAMMGILSIFTLGSKYIIQNLFIYTMTFSQNYYSEMLLKNFFVIQLFYYVCCRSRVTLKYFPLLSMQISLLVLFLNWKFYCHNVSWLVNFHLLIHLFLMAIFAAVENYIGRSQFHSQFTPSEEKPRSMYFIGYDISWQNSLPPIWTYFTTQFDLKCFNEKEKALINRDYQLVYGRLLGMNDRQELPEDQEPSRQEESHQLNQNLSESNQMSLIR